MRESDSIFVSVFVLVVVDLLVPVYAVGLTEEDMNKAQVKCNNFLV